MLGTMGSRGHGRTMGLLRSKLSLHKYMCLLVAFSLVALHNANVVQALGLSNPPNQSATGRQSTLSVLVRNLDWTVSQDEISKQLLQVANVNINTNAENSNTPQVRVQFKNLSTPRRKRDEDKLHGGSATLTFATTQEAAMAMGRLGSQNSQSQSQSQSNWKVQWAWEPEVSTVKNNQEEEVLAERQARRKERAEHYVRRRQRIAQRTDEVIQSVLRESDTNTETDTDTDSIANLQDDDIDMVSSLSSLPIRVLQAPRLDWSQCPNAIDPIRGGGLLEGTPRAERKQAAVEAFLHVLENALLDDNTDEGNDNERVIADLGCGAGNLSLGLAWWLQHKKKNRSVLAVDINGRSLDILGRRAKEAQADSRGAQVSSYIETMEQDLLRLIRGPQDSDSTVENTSPVLLPADCSAVVSLHACGSASDMAMAVATSHSLPFAISPCCIGKVNTLRKPQYLVSGRIMNHESNVNKSGAPVDFSYPRSAWLTAALKDSLESYQLLTRAADYGVVGDLQVDEEEIARRVRCRKAKQIVETDRLLWAKQEGYYVRMLELPRIGPSYPKRELLLGAKKGTKAAFRISQLLTTDTIQY
jgi:SAM-dependent methyltransferase